MKELSSFSKEKEEFSVPFLHMQMIMRPPATVAMHVHMLVWRYGYGEALAVAHTALRDDLSGELPYRHVRAAQNRKFQAAFVVEVDAHGGKRQVVIVVIHLQQALRQVALAVRIDVNQCRDALAFVRRGRGVAQACAHQVAHGFRAILIISWPDEAVDTLEQIVIERNGNALHEVSSMYALFDGLLRVASCMMFFD
jgi:hypothetical protein